jgi:hypothetical protein
VTTRRRASWAAIATLALALGLAVPAAQGAALNYVTAGPAALSKDSQSATTAPCPVDTHVVGGGQYILSGYSDATLTSSTPIDGIDRNTAPDDGWKSTVRNFNPMDTVTVFAICTRKPVTYKGDKAAAGPGRVANTARVACPRGTHVTGGGVKLPVAYEDGGWLESSAPFDGADGDSKADDGWTVSGGVEERRVKMKLTAICAEGGARGGFGKLKYATGSGSAPTMNYGEASATCPGSARVTGGGVTTQGVAFHPMTISSPFDSATDTNARPDNGWQGEFDNYSNSDPGLITAYVICLE